MSNYCEAADIGIALGAQVTYSVTSRPTLTQVEAIISNITNEIDFVLSSVGINTQPTDSRILGRLKEACIIGSAARVGFAYLNPNQDADNTLPGLYWKRYQDILKEIKDSPEIYGVISDTTMYISSPVIDGTITASELKKFYPSSRFNP